MYRDELMKGTKKFALNVGKKEGKMSVMSQRYLFIGIACAVLLAVLAGCGAPSMRVPVTRPAEIYLTEPRKIVVGEFQGNGGQAVAAALTRQIVGTSRFEVLDQASLEKKLRESNPSLQPTATKAVTSALLDKLYRPGKNRLFDRDTMEGLLREADPKLVGPDQQTIAAELAKLVGGGYLISGEVTAYSYVQKDSKELSQRDAQGKQHETNLKQGTANVAASVQITNLSTGVIVVNRNVSKTADRMAKAVDALPPDPDKNALLSEAVNGAVASFVRRITPYTDYVTVTFAKNEQKLPELDQGVNYARSGLWPEAAEQFKAAAAKYPKDQGAWWNLGIAYEYSHRFAEAEEALKEAGRVAPCDKCGREIQNVRWLAENIKKLQEQGVR